MPSTIRSASARPAAGDRLRPPTQQPEATKSPSSPGTLVVGDLEIRADAGEVRLRGELIPLTRTEFLLLCELGAHAGQVLSRQQLLQRVWEYEFGDERLVDVHVGRLRQKIEDDTAAPQRLVTVRGLGYKLQR